MKTTVFYSVNDGLCFWNGQHALMLDYLFDNTVATWSDLPEAVYRHMQEHTGEFSREHTLLFTHNHPDHYSAKYVAIYKELYSARIYGLGISDTNLSAISLEENVSLLELPGYQVFFLRTKHQGNGKYANTENSMICVCSEDHWYIHCGDSVLDESCFRKITRLGVSEPDIVFVNYYHIIPAGQRHYLKRFEAKQTQVIHFPFPEAGGSQLKKQLVSLLDKSVDPFLKSIKLPEPMSFVM